MNALRDALFGVFLFLVSFGLRLAAALRFAGEPVWDGHYYDFGAHRIAEGFGYSDDIVVEGARVWHPWCHYPVGYSAYLGAFYKLFGGAPIVAHVADSLAGALLAVFTFLLAREALSPLRARVAGLLVALHPGLILWGALLMSEPLSALLVLAAFWAALRTKRSAFGERRPLAAVAIGALVLGVATLVRPQALLCAPLLALAYPARDLRARLGAVAIACGVTLLPVLPWTARNCSVMDGCALVSTNAGWNLAIGSFPRATGRFETLRSSDGCREVTGQVQQDRCWLAYGFDHILEHPWRWLSLVPAKLGFTFDHESFEVEYLHEARPSAWPEDRRVLARGMTTAMHRLLVVASALACVGIALGSRARRDDRVEKQARLVQGAMLGFVGLVAAVGAARDAATFWPVVLLACALPWIRLPGRPSAPPAILMCAGLVATIVVTHAVFFGEDRYHVVATPALCLLAAAGLRETRRLREARARA
ncbi:MAG TPA: glycosyltransferase family 39 protein [Labilithrix sp.]